MKFLIFTIGDGDSGSGGGGQAAVWCLAILSLACLAPWNGALYMTIWAISLLLGLWLSDDFNGLDWGDYNGLVWLIILPCAIALTYFAHRFHWGAQWVNVINYCWHIVYVIFHYTLYFFLMILHWIMEFLSDLFTNG